MAAEEAKLTERSQDNVDADLIDFEGPDDPYHPLQWPLGKKVTTTILYSFCTMATTWASTMSVIRFNLDHS